MPPVKLDSCFSRIGQALARERSTTNDSKEDVRYAVKRINQQLCNEKLNAELIGKYSNVIVDLLLSVTNMPEDMEYFDQILTIVRETLECDRKSRRPLVKALIKNEACTFLLHNLRSCSDDRGLGQEISLKIHYILAIIGHHDKRLALKARLFKTLGSTVNLLRIYSYNAKVAPVLLTLLKIYAKNAITAAAICRASGLQPLLRLAFTLDRRYGKLQKLSITVVRYLTQTKKLAARATTSTIVNDLLAVVFLMDKSQGQNRIRTMKIKEGLLKVLLNLVKSSEKIAEETQSKGFCLLYEMSMNVLSNETFCTFVDLACQIMIHCCPKQTLPIEATFSSIRFVLPQGYDYIVNNEMAIADPQTVKDIENLREKCKSVITNAERTSSSENRFRPKSSMNSVLTRTPSMSRNSSTTVAAAAASTQSSNVVTSRPRSCKGTRVDKKTSEKKTTTKRKPTTTNGQKPRRILKLESQDLDDNEIRLLDDDDLEEDESPKSDDDDEEDEDDEDDEEDRGQKQKPSSSAIPLVNGETVARDAVELANAYDGFFDELADPIHLLRSKMLRTRLDSATENFISKLFRQEKSHDFVSLHERSKFSYWRMSSSNYFQIYSLLAKSTKSAYQFTKLAYPDAFNALSYPKFEPMQKAEEQNTRMTLLSDIRRILYPPTVDIRVVYDFDAIVNRFAPKTLTNDDEQRCQMRWSGEHLVFDSQFECGNLRKAIQITDEEYDLILRPDINTFRYHQWFYFEVANMRRDTTYRLNIINFEKINSQFNYGMQPVMFSVREAMQGRPYWRRFGERICYYKNTYGKKKKVYYTLTFHVRFPHDHDVCYIAYHYPYTYTSLMTDLVNWSSTYDRSNIYFRQQSLCKTLSGNDCPLLTITSFYNENSVYQNERQTIPLHERSYVILTSRVHPGESNASWVMKGIIDYLLSDEPTARLLRDRFIFKIIPMLNPDGVINGCQRCSLSTKDLNRQWSSPNPVLFPTIYHTKGLIAYLSMCCSRPITLFCDFHGHSRQKNFFFYGNDPRLHFLGPAVGRSTIPKIFPRLFDGVPGFALQSCLFTMRKQKEGCARIVVWDEFKVDFAYTMEATYSGFDVGIYKGLQIQISLLQMIGHDFCRVLVKLIDQELKQAEIIVPFEDLFVNERNDEDEKQTKTTEDKRRNLSSDSSSSSNSLDSCSLSSTDGLDTR